MSITAMSPMSARDPAKNAVRSFRIGTAPGRELVFPRTQSSALRDCPWEDRMKPMKSWAELGSYGLVGLASIALITALI